MKKIIYSFVIMIAAGSLFTSCVTNTEPQGVKDLREAKADYLASLSKLREADAEKVKAEAALVQAKAATEQARAALVQAAAKAKEIENDFNAAENAIALDTLKAAAEVALAIQEQKLAEAEENLRAYLVKIEEQSKQLTDEEKGIVEAYTKAYKDVIAKEATVREKEKTLYNKTYNSYGEKSVEAAKAEYEQDKALAEQSKAYWETVLAANQELSDEQIADYDQWVKAYDALKAENEGFKYDKAQIVKDSSLNEYENKAVLDSFYAKVDAKAKAISDARGGFSFKKFEANLPVVSFTEGSVVETFVNFAKTIDSVTISADHKKMEVAASKSKDAVKNVVDSLNIIIDALNREGVVVDQIVKDTTGIAALVAKTNAEYKAVKDTLSAGVEAWDGIKVAKDSVKKVEGKPAAARAQHAKDTAALFKSITTFIDVWNEIAGTSGKTLDTETIRGQKYNDSLDIFNALKGIMEQRKSVFGKDTKFVFWYYNRSQAKTKDSVDFSKIDFADLRNGVYNLTNGDDRNGFLALLNDAFGTKNLFDDFMYENPENGLSNKKLKIEKITVPDIKGKGSPQTKSVLFQNLLFGEWYVLGENTVYGEIYKAGAPTEDTKYAKIYCKQAVEDSTNASNLVVAARKKYYQNFYCTYWGLKYADLQNFDFDNVKFTNDADSLHVDAFTEKTFTDPKLLVTFSGKEGFFTHSAKSKDAATINWDKVDYNDTSAALIAIKSQLGKNYIKLSTAADYTLYAKTLAVTQFATGALNYKENTKALAELTKIVKAVETAYNDAVSAASAGSTKADSLQIALTGKKDGKIVNHDITDGFISKDGKGTFKLAGEQKELAEKWIADYAKAYSELEAQKAEINVTISDNNTLANIYSTYIMKLAQLDKKAGSNPDEVLKSVKGYWYGYDVTYKNFWGQTITEHIDGVLEQLQENVDVAEEAIKVAEGKLAKLEAGYDQSQIDIESAQDELAKAQAELKEAEVKLAAAKEAYKAVLAAHGITE